MLPAGPLAGVPFLGDIAALLAGFATALQPAYLLYALVGVTLGTAVGVLPGIGPAMTVALVDDEYGYSAYSPDLQGVVAGSGHARGDRATHAGSNG